MNLCWYWESFIQLSSSKWLCISLQILWLLEIKRWKISKFTKPCFISYSCINVCQVHWKAGSSLETRLLSYTASPFSLIQQKNVILSCLNKGVEQVVKVGEGRFKCLWLAIARGNSLGYIGAVTWGSGDMLPHMMS